MNIKEFIQKTNLDNSLLVGFYGGGNYGDELLMEVLCKLFSDKDTTDIYVAYRNQKSFSTFHKDYGYKLFDITSYKSFISTIWRSKNVIIGGGGLWGMDVNRRILFLSVLLFICRWVLRKKVYLLGVGYYNSTNWLGRVSAFFAGKAANEIFARDKETFDNFRRVNKRARLDKDIAWYIEGVDLRKGYGIDLQRLQQQLHIKGTSFLISLRRFQLSHKNNFTEVLEAVIAKQPNVQFIVMILEPKEVDPENYKLMRTWQKHYKNVQIIDFSFNPMALLLLFAAHKAKLRYIGPQFHGIITANVNGVPFFPVAYDNKVTELIKQVSPNEHIIKISDVKEVQVIRFIEQHKEK